MNPESVIRSYKSKGVVGWFTFRRALPAVFVFGVFAVIESIAQGLGIVAAYPNLAQRTKVVEALSSNGALSFFYGTNNPSIVTAAGYMVYRILPILALIGAIWSITFITKMLRGQEESGRWDLFLSGRVSQRQATIKVILAAIGGIGIAYILICLAMAAIGRNHNLYISFTGSLYYSLAVISGPLMATSIGAVTSQLAPTRRRAMLQGILLVVILYLIRSVANTISSLEWLKVITPFGWIDKLMPFYHPGYIWLLPVGLLTICLCALAVWLAGRRDSGCSFIAENDYIKPKYGLLNSLVAFDYRANRNVLFGYLSSAVLVSAIVASVDKTVGKALGSAGNFSKALSKFSGNASAHIDIAYLSAAGFMVLLILLVISTVSLNAAKEEELSSKLDNLISSKVTRTKWLSSRLVLLISWLLLTTVVSNFVVYGIARIEKVNVSAHLMMIGGLNILAPAILLIGIGVALYGLAPRLTSIIMYLAIVWSFTMGIVASLTTNTFLKDASLFHYSSLVPAVNPDWKTFTITSLAGLILVVFGFITFNRRDLKDE